MGDPQLLVALVGGVSGLAFGAVGRWSSFCVRGAVEDLVGGRAGSPRLVGYVMALAVALAGVQGLVLWGLLDPSQTVHLPGTLGLGGIIGGGLAFGCGARLLVLGSGGNLRALLVLLAFGLVAYATMRGILSPLRGLIAGGGLALAGSGKEASIATLLSAGLALDARLVRAIVAGGALLAAVCIAIRFPSWHGVLGGGLIGALVVASFVATGIVLADELEPRPTEGLSVTRGLGDALVYLLTWTGSSISFAIAWIFGVPLGAATIAALRGELRLEGFTAPRQMLRYLAGGALMGFGGVLALGCTIGNGLTGLALLGPGALIATLSILAGAAATMIWQRRVLPRAGAAATAAPG
jgi:hypothetical protein